MNKKKILIYAMVTIFAVVITIWGIARYYKINIPGAITLFLAFPQGKELPVEDIVPKDISAEISAIKEWEQRIELPKDKEMATRVQNALETAREFWNECQNLVNSHQVKIWYWNGMYSGSWESKDKKEAIYFTFRSDKGGIRACSKSFYVDETLAFKALIREKGWELQLYDDLNDIKWCHLNSGGEILHFYLGNKIQDYSCKLEWQGDTQYVYVVEWDENGKIVRER